MKKGLILLSIAGFFLVLIILSHSGGLPERFEAPDFTLKDIFSGQEIKFSEHKGRPLVLYFFASW